MTEVERLERELSEIDREIEAAAVDGDYVTWSERSMRKAALPALIRQAKAEPILQEIGRLEQELSSLDDELERVREAPPPSVPDRLKTSMTPAGMKSAALSNVAGRASSLGRELRQQHLLLQRTLEAEESQL